MVNLSNYLVKAQPQIWGRWSVWDKLAKAKKTIKDAYAKVIGKTLPEAQVEEPLSAVKLPSAVAKQGKFHRLITQYSKNTKGYARLQHQPRMRAGLWGRGVGPFGRDFLWRRLRTGHLVGFATLFLVHEERVEEEVAFRKRMETYGKICENIQRVFKCLPEDESNTFNPGLGKRISDYDSWKGIAAGSNGGVYEAEITDVGSEKTSDCKSGNVRPKHAERSANKTTDVKCKGKKKVAIKMIYNFNSSNAGSIYRQARAELITCGRGALDGLSKNWQNGSRARMKPHPNILKVERAIIDSVPDDPEIARISPAVVPHPTGFGRSTAMFLVTKRYEGTLDEFLKISKPSVQTCHIMALQLLNGVSHLERNKIAHRDLKSNNILYEWDSSKLPRLVIADFGCALVPGPGEDLVCPFLSPMYDIRNGNAAVQPPEICDSHPGRDSVLNYTKADAWAVGLLLCELMGFDKNQLDSHIPVSEGGLVILHLIRRLLDKNLETRMTCCEAARILHLELFGPKFTEVAGREEEPGIEPVVNNWLTLHASETLAYKNTNWGRNSVVCDLFTSFLSTIEWTDLHSGISSWQSLHFYCN